MPCHEKHVFTSENAPAAIGPYSVAAGGGPFIFTAGQIGLNPKTNELVEGGIEGQTRQVMTNLNAVLKTASSCLKNAVKTTVYLKDMADFQVMNKIYAEFFNETPPARTTIQAAGLPRNALVEIDVIALLCGDEHCECSD